MSEIKKLLESNIIFTPAVVCYLVKDNEVILGLRKKVSLGLGENLIAGIGGKIGDEEGLEDETPEEALKREVKEEIKVEITKFRKMGRVKFIFPHKPKWNQDVLVYVVDEWEGEPKETDPIKPMIYGINQIPFDQMWDDNKYWVPLVLKGEQVNAIFLFDENTKVKEKIFFD